MYREVQYKGETIGYTYKYTNSKYNRVRVDRKSLDVLVSINNGESLQSIDSFVLKYGDYILETKKALLNNKRKTYDNYTNCSEGDSFYLLGKKISLKIIQSDKNMVQADENHIYLYTDKPKNKTVIKNMINQYFKQIANNVFLELLQKYYHLFFDAAQIPMPTLQIKKVNSYWGKCYFNKGKIIINQYLIHAPLQCIECIVAHEVCHLLNNGHGKAFYMLLTKVMPDYYDRLAQLKKFKTSA